MINEEIKPMKAVFTNNEISPFVFDLLCTFRDIKKVQTVDSVYVNLANDKLEIYVFYLKEDFNIEDEIVKYITNWEEQYGYFREVFVYALDKIEKKELALPLGVMEI